MKQVAAKVILVSLAVAATTRDGLEKFDNPRFLTFGSVPSESDVKREIGSFTEIPEETTPLSIEKIEDLTTDNIPSPQEIRSNPNFNFELLLKEIKSCRKRFPKMSDRKFNFKLYGILLNELTKSSNKTSTHNFCNISKELLDGLRDTLHNLEVFHRDLLPKYESTEFPNLMENSQQTIDPETFYSQRNFVRVEVENNLNFKLGEEWIPLQHKINHMSHIYLGSSIFPLFTEESRIIDKYHTLPSPSTTKKTHITHNGNSKQSRTAEEVHRLLSPLRWQIDYKKREAMRYCRGLEKEQKTLPEAESIEENLIPLTTTPPLEGVDSPRLMRRSVNGGEAFKAADAIGQLGAAVNHPETRKFVGSLEKDFKKIFNITKLFD